MISYSISAIIPAFNCGSTLERAVYSLINQLFPPDEIIIINNNSTDKTQKIIDHLIAENPDLIISVFEQKPGANAARNSGLKIAKGDWIQLLDADDELLPDKLKHQIELIHNNPDSDVIYADSKEYLFSKKTAKYELHKTNFVAYDLIEGLINSTLGRTNANLWKRSALEKVNYFDENKKSNQEYFLMLSLYETGAKFFKDPVINSKIYVDGDSISRTSDGPRSVEMLRTRLEYFQSLRQVLKNKKELSDALLSKIKKKIRLSYYNNYYNYNNVCKEELLKLKVNYDIQPTLTDKVITHAHQVYSQNCPKKGIAKYFIFIYYFFAKINRIN